MGYEMEVRFFERFGFFVLRWTWDYIISGNRLVKVVSNLF